jgi:mRNA interferase MazF
MPRRGEVWRVDLGIAGKVRPVLVLTSPPREQDRNLYTVLSRTTSTRGSQWELTINKPFFSKPGAFDFQQIQSVDYKYFAGKLGELTTSEMQTVDEYLKRRLSL